MDTKYTEHHQCFEYLKSLPKDEFFKIILRCYRNVTKSTIANKLLDAHIYTEDYYNGVSCELIILSLNKAFGKVFTLSRNMSSGEIKFYNLSIVSKKQHINSAPIGELVSVIRAHKLSKLK
jgi:hypothetical protein